MKKPKVLIAGGGIGGLATAIALLQRGVDVEVFEQASELREFGAGIQISPNGNRVLGVSDFLCKRFGLQWTEMRSTTCGISCSRSSATASPT